MVQAEQEESVQGLREAQPARQGGWGRWWAVSRDDGEAGSACRHGRALSVDMDGSSRWACSWRYCHVQPAAKAGKHPAGDGCKT